MYKLASIALVTVAYLLSVARGGELEISEHELPCERLSNNVKPTGYQLELQFPSFEAQTYHGQVNISFRFPNEKKEAGGAAYKQLAKALRSETCDFGGSTSDTIILHADQSIELLDVEVISTSSGWGFGFGKSDKKLAIVDISRDTAKQLIAIKLQSGSVNAAGGLGQLLIKFESKFRQDKHGVYLSKFNDGNKTYKHVVSYFQPTGARLVFPAFDEPRFKVPFQVRLVHPTGLTALSNTEVESSEPAGKQLTRTTFKQTPPMPVHMVAFTVGEFDEPLGIESRSTIDEQKSYKVRVFTEPGKRDAGRFALEVAQRSLQYFEQFIDFEFPLDKFDIVAISDHDQDNTEHWGLAFVRDPLIWVDDETKPDTKITTAVNVAHVCVHQWFANLITVSWWNDLWITEGVASSFAFQLVRELYPEFESEYFVRLATLSGVMQKDSSGKQHVLKPKLKDLRTSEQVYKVFDNIGFMKSAALATMINKLLAKSSKSDWYQTVLRSLVKLFAYGNVNRDDYLATVKFSLLEHYKASDRDFRTDDVEILIEHFGSLEGVPVLNARLDNKQVGNELHFDWELMHHARQDVYGPDFWQPQKVQVYDDYFIGHSQSPSQIVDIPTTRSWTVKDIGDLEYLKVSSQPDIHTYFRTRYSDNLYAQLKEPISSRSLSAMDRLQVLDDANALVQAQLIKNDTFKQLLECYAHEDNGAVLLELMVASKTLAGLETSDKSESSAGKAIFNLFTKFGFSVSGHETLLEQRSRSVALKALIMQGNQQVIEAALKAYDESLGYVALFLREPVYAAVVLHGSEAQIDQLISHTATKSYEEKLRLATALSLSSNLRVLEKLWFWLNNYSELEADVTKPFCDIISPKLWHRA